MPSARGNNFTTVEVKPDGLPSRSNLAPASPSSPKAVRFAPAESRPLTQAEAWSLYHFEKHANGCRACHNPLDGAREGRRLCEAGMSLARDVAGYMYRLDGAVYSRTRDDHKLVQVEMPSGYTHVNQLLRSTERAPRSAARTVPIISYEQSTPKASRRIVSKETDDYAVKTTVVLEPSGSERKSDRKSHRKSPRYEAFVVEDDVEEATSRRRTAVPDDERRGSLYHEDKQKQRKEAYRVEYREPERRERRRDRERPTSVFWD